MLGVRVPAIRKLVTAFRGRLDLDTASSLVDAQFASQCREEMLFGVLLLAPFRRQLSSALWPRIDRWIDAIENWEVCDQLAMGVAGEIVANDLSLLPDLESWVRSDNRWRRRFALAATTALNQNGRRNAADTLAICKGAITEREPIVRKAVAWALREACKSDEHAVFELLAANRGRMHPSVVRDTLPKLTAAHRTSLR